MAQVRARFGDKVLSPYVLAVVATRCGRPEQALALLQEAIAVRDPSVAMLSLDPSFAALRGDPRWPAVLALRVPRRAE